MLGVQDEYQPYPSKKVLPQWYKDMDSYIHGKKEILIDAQPSQTIKRCMPVFDALTFGYIIPTYTDVYVRIENGGPYFSWSSIKAIDFHAPQQLTTYPRSEEQKKQAAPKWINPWSIKVPRGYSVLFLPPIHQDNSVFEILEGVVDCDTYTNQVNFPFLMKDPNFEGLIPAGTPLVQVIPFKREKWQMEKGGLLERQEAENAYHKLKVKFFDSYRNTFRSNKDFD
jgi:hypothetical protein